MVKKVLGTVLVSVAVLSLAFIVCAADTEETDAKEPTSTISLLRGYIYDIPPYQDRIPIQGVRVTTWYAAEEGYKIHDYSETDRNGWFTVKYDPIVKYISFDLDDYTVKGWCSELQHTGDSNMFVISLKDESETGGIHDLFDDSGYTAIVSRTVGTIFGTVATEKGDGIMTLKGAEVTIVSDSTILTTTTDESGYFSFSCPSGTDYKLIISAPGFYDLTIEGVKPSQSAYSYRLIEKEHMIIFGMDLPHTLELFGLLFLVLIALLTIYFVRRPSTADSIAVINDLPTFKIEEDEDGSGPNQ